MLYSPPAVSVPDFLAALWPVGGPLFITQSSINPAELLGFGVWVQVGQGRFLVGQDVGQVEFDTLGKADGVKDVTLTVGQSPPHTHVQDAHTHVQDAHTHTQTAHSHGEQLQGGTTGTTTGTHLMGSAATGGSLRTAGQNTLPATATNQTATATNQTATATNQSTGGGLPHTNLPPYLVVRFWVRTA